MVACTLPAIGAGDGLVHPDPLVSKVQHVLAEPAVEVDDDVKMTA
jgi:hypothetical protein